ncbi:hypothetical protein BJ166DRAFT_502899 [Pestalotiopsis sp. NC0098]|nr:hypothetical protein BJ166DRAFT_502899 [Pestalotiopsis sp. NC0098]
MISLPERSRVIYAGQQKDYTLWNKHKDTLGLLFLDRNHTLKEVKQRMEIEYGFPVLPLNDYEIVLRDRFQFRKNVRSSDWASIGHRIEKRKLAGKASNVYLCGRLMPSRKTKKEVSRHGPKVDPIEPAKIKFLAIYNPQGSLVSGFSSSSTQARSDLRLHGSIPGTTDLNAIVSQEHMRDLATPGSHLLASLSSSLSIDEAFIPNILSQACFMLSNHVDMEGRTTRKLLDWLPALRVVKRLFSSGTSLDDVDSKFRFGREFDDYVTPLGYSAKALQADIIEVLIENGANVNLQSFWQNRGTTERFLDTPLFTLVSRDFLGEKLNSASSADILFCIRLLLDAGADMDVESRKVRKLRAKQDDPDEESSFDSQAQVLMVSLGWFQGPNWLTDIAWFDMGARAGLESLDAYLQSRQFPSSTNERICLLEIAISEAAGLGCLETVTCLLQFGVDPNVGTLNGQDNHWNPAARAVSQGHYNVLQTLRENGSNFLLQQIIEQELSRHDFNELLLRTHSEHGDKMEEVVDFLLAQGAYIGLPDQSESLLEAIFGRYRNARIWSGQPEYLGHGSSEWHRLLRIFEKLIDLGAFVDACCERGSWGESILELLIRKKETSNTLILRVIGVTTDVDQQGTLLVMAFQYEREAVVERLLSRGAKVDHPPNNPPISVLAAACQSCSDAMIERLIELGAGVNDHPASKPTNMKPLQMAAYAGRINVACLLIKHGAEVNAIWEYINVLYETMYGTPLDRAAEGGRLDMVQLLRDAGGRSANPGATGVEGAIKEAEENGHYIVAGFLRGRH